MKPAALGSRLTDDQHGELQGPLSFAPLGQGVVQELRIEEAEKGSVTTVAVEDELRGLLLRVDLVVVLLPEESLSR